MSLTFGFYNSLNGDRKYNAEQMSSLFDGIIRDGIFMSLGDALIVTASSGMSVNVGEGRAWFNNTWTNNNTPLVLTVENSEVALQRIDLVVLEVNKSGAMRQNRIILVKGVPGSNPVAPVIIKSELVNQYPLCSILINAGTTSILQANITNRRGTVDCPFVSGILETVNIDTLLIQWASEFDTWFDTLQNILDANTAANLLNLITSLGTYATAGGTATAITVTTAHFMGTNGEIVNFISGLANGKASTTIAVNGGTARSAYVMGTTTAPNLAASKPYTFIYNSANTCYYQISSDVSSVNTNLELDSSNALLTGTKKADALCWDGSCIYKNTVTSGSVELANTILSNLRFGKYSVGIRLRTANKTLTTDAIQIKVQKNIGGSYSDIYTRAIKANEFADTTNYQTFYIPFEYTSTKATDNKLKVLITLLTQASAYEVALDSIIIYPVGIGVFTA